MPPAAAHPMRRTARSRLCVLGVLLAVLVPFVATTSASAAACAPEPAWPSPDPAPAAEVLALVNAHRAGLGLPALAPSPALGAAAAWKAADMAAYDYLAHDDPAPPVARTYDQRIFACGYPGQFVGENIAYGQPTPQEVVDAWLASPDHRENIERPQFRATGVAAARDASGVVFWSQEFGDVVDPVPAQPAAPAPAPAVDAPSRARATSPVGDVRLVGRGGVLLVLRRRAQVVVDVRRRAPARRAVRRATLRLAAGVHRVRLDPRRARLRPGRYRITVRVTGVARPWALALVVPRS